MKTLKSFARTILFPAVTALKAEKMLSGMSGKGNLVLAYHGVNDHPNFNINGRHIGTAQLDKHFAYLKANFNVLTLAEVFDNYRQNKPAGPGKKNIAITFDDGYLNNYTTALPLLEKHEIPATFYITSSCLTNDQFILWPDIIDLLKYSVTDHIKVGDEVFEFSNGSIPYSRALQCNIYDYFKNMAEERETIFTRLIADYKLSEFLPGIDKGNYKLVNSDQLKLFAQSKFVEIGSHTHTHYNLSNVPLALAEKELVLSKQLIEAAIGKEIISIAYPDGSYNEAVKQLSLKAGYKNLLAVDYMCSNDDADTNILPRLCISNTTTFHSNVISINKSFGKVGF